jgi:putative FmdB family regulatory protein
MPIYAYRCETCGYAKDVLQKISDPVLSVCPNCGASTFRKQVTAAGFQLKGSGWYVTDFRGGDKKGGAKPAGDDAPAAPAADGGTSGSVAGSSAGGEAAPAPAPAASEKKAAPAASDKPAAAPPPASGSAGK